MGKSTRIKNEIKREAEQKLMASFTLANKIAKQPPQVQEPNLINFLYDHYKFIRRDPVKYKIRTKSDDRNKQLLELVRYAFADYPVCKVLTSIWQAPKHPTNDRNHYQRQFYRQQDAEKHLVIPEADKILPEDFRAWYICVAQGGSLYKQYAKQHLTKKEVHVLVTCPHDIGIVQGLYYSVAKAHCNNDGSALRVARSKIVTKKFDTFWRSVARFFSEHEPKDLPQMNDLIDYLSAKLTETEQENARLRIRNGPNVEFMPLEFTMAGQTLEGLLKKQHDWHMALRRVKVMGDYVWEGNGLPDEIIKLNDQFGAEVFWHFHQIKNAKELAAEGNRMRHCVYSYRDGCVNNRLSIWNLSKQNGEFGMVTPKITIELRNDGRIVQARGTANRKPKPEEEFAMKRWSNKNGLTYTPDSFY